MPEEIIYTARATSTGDGRNGRARSSDGLLDVEVRIPIEMGGSGGATNPEQLFAAGYAACFHSALKGTKRDHGVDVTDSWVTAEVGIGRNHDGGYGLDVTLRVTMGGDVSQGDAERAAMTAHKVCPYSNSIRGNVDVKLVVKVA